MKTQIRVTVEVLKGGRLVPGRSNSEILDLSESWPEHTITDGLREDGYRALEGNEFFIYRRGNTEYRQRGDLLLTMTNQNEKSRVFVSSISSMNVGTGQVIWCPKTR